MKWIGQHIWDYISRFRNDVYLEDISTGTIASGGNLGLDSNNKIVKADTEAGELAFSGSTTNGVLTYGGASQIDVESTLTYNGGTGIMLLESSISTTPQILINNTNTDATSGKLVFQKSAAGSDNDDVGVIAFNSQDDGGGDQGFAQIVGEIADASNNDEAGKIRIGILTDGSALQDAFIATGLGTGERVDIGLGHGNTSTTTIAGTLTMGSTAFVNNSGVVQVATQGTIDHDSLANFVANEHIDWTGDVSASSVIHTNNITDLHGAGVDGSADQLLTDDGDGTVTSESSLTYNTSFGTALIMASALPQIIIRNTNDDIGGGGITLSNFRGTSLSALSVNDILGQIVFSGGDSGGGLTNYANIEGSVRSSTATDEAGYLSLQAAASDGTTTGLQTGILLTGDPTSGEIDISIGYGPASITTINGHLLVEGVTQFNGQLEIGNANDTTLVRSSGGTLTVEGNTVATTNLALDSFADSTSNAIGVGTVELGHASDTTIARSAAGTVTIEGEEVITAATIGWHGSTTRIKILHSDIIADDGGRPYMINDIAVGSDKLFGQTMGALTAYATVAIPTGFAATHVMIYGICGGTCPAVEVWESQIDSIVGVSKGTGNVNTEINITDVTSSTTNYLFIQIIQGSTDYISGGYVTIAAV